MTNGNTVATAIRDQLRDIPDLVTAIGDADRITVFEEAVFDDVDYFKALAQLPAGSILVVYSRSVVPQTGPRELTFTINWRPAPGGIPADIEALILNGVPASGGGRQFVVQQFSGEVDSPARIECNRRTVLIGDDSRMTYWEMSLTVRENSLL